MKSKLLSLVVLGLAATTAQASWVSTYFQWTNLGLGSGQTVRGNYVRSIPGSDSLEQLRMNYGSMALKQIYASMSNSQVQANNENLLELIKDDINFNRNINRYQPMNDALLSLDDDQIRELYRAMTSNYVVQNQRNYGGRGVGFCFGRALVAHNQALIRNVHPNAIRKIWVVGDMGFWGHHVSTIVKSGESWVAIDNYTGIVTVEDWMERMQQEKQGSKDLMFFITRAGRFGHATNSLYNTIDLFNVPANRMQQYADTTAKNNLKSRDFYKGFFMDFYDALESDAVTVRRFSESEAQAQREEAARIERLAQAEREAFEQSVKASDVSEFKLSQETIYCFNSENQKLNCNYQLGKDTTKFETSVTITGNAQYLIQIRESEKIYARHITREELSDYSAQIVEDENGVLTKRYVTLIKPQHAPIRPYMRVISTDQTSSQAELQQEVQKIKDVLATFNEDYQVHAENASPLVRIQNSQN
ncbi:MAG: hypothetical protein VYA54_02050 [Bdellovibrionota bacterium]|nr:hypothetical protein [Bdellovibrionota bacterium]